MSRLRSRIVCTPESIGDAGLLRDRHVWHSGRVDARISQRLTIAASEFTWRFSKSSGPGGQHVNTTDTRAELSWDVGASATLSEGQKQRLLTSLGGTLVDGVLTVSAS